MTAIGLDEVTSQRSFFPADTGAPHPIRQGVDDMRGPSPRMQMRRATVAKTVAAFTLTFGEVAVGSTFRAAMTALVPRVRGLGAIQSSQDRVSAPRSEFHFGTDPIAEEANWNRALELLRARGYDPDELVTQAIRNLAAWQDRPADERLVPAPDDDA